MEFSLGDSGLVYEAGDALGVMPENCPELVSEILRLLSCDGEESVRVGSETLPLRLALTQHCDLGKPSPDLLRLLGLSSGEPGKGPLQLIDALQAPGGVLPPPAALVSALKKLQPRLYSISSSPKHRPGEVHLTVGALRYQAAGTLRKGVCSTFIAERLLTKGSAGVFIHSNRAFRPPEDGTKPLIMIGPGTGIAPFRAFLQERKLSGAKGDNWLFFGDQHEATDFLYRNEIESWLAEGFLRLSSAWSRDQLEKIYVQHRMIEQGAELWSWLSRGASIYVCGDASRMARDVENALLEIVSTHGGLSGEQALAFLDTLKAERRYQRDVY